MKVSASSENIGHSTLGRPLTVEFSAAQSGRPRVFIMAGQHGDEPDARLAASQYLAGLKSGPAHVAVLADANPDGAAVNTRRNANDVDLNRDHLLLNAPETAAIHSFVDRWNPDLVIDVHTYRPGRPELLQHGLVFPQDVMADIPTNPAAWSGEPNDVGNDFLDFLRKRMAEAGIRCDRYTLVRPSGMVRHSNFDIIDARNGLALRFGIPTVLLEGRRPAPGDPAGFVPPHLALLRAIESTVEWAGGRSANLPASDLIPIGCEYARSGDLTRQMEMMSAASGEIRMAGIPGPYMPLVKTTESIRLPRAYAVPRNSEILELLKRHRLETASSESECWRGAVVEMHRILSPLPTFQAEEPAPPPELALERGPLNSAGMDLFPTSQRGGMALALLLEPKSQFALYRFNDLHLKLRPGMLYPVGRVI